MELLGEVLRLLWQATSLLFSLLSAAWWRVVALFQVPLEPVWKTASLLGTLLGVLWGWILVGGLVGTAAGLRVFGVDDTYRSLSRLFSSGDAADDDVLEAIQTIPHEEFTDSQGRFSPAAFRQLTGMTPPEFVHLYVASRGGRVKQQTLANCLPWSKPTVSRVLDTLEENDLARRVNNGRENIVCTPDALPEEIYEDGVYSDFDG